MHSMSPNADGPDGKNGKQRKLELGEKPVTVDFANAPRIDAKTSMDDNTAQGADVEAKVNELRRQCIDAHQEHQNNLGLLDQRAKHVEDEVTKLALFMAEVHKAVLTLHDGQNKVEGETARISDDVAAQQATIIEMEQRQATHGTEIAGHIEAMKARLEDTAGVTLERHEQNFSDVQGFAQKAHDKIVLIEAELAALGSVSGNVTEQVKVIEARLARAEQRSSAPPPPTATTSASSRRWTPGPQFNMG